MVIAYFGGAGAFGGKNTIPPTVDVGTYTYNGKAQGPTVTGFDPKRMVISNATATEPGTYNLTISLKNKKTMTWKDTKTNADKVYPYTIHKITVSNPSVSNTTLEYTGGSIGPNISYNTTYASISGVSKATTAGSYTFYIALKDTDHYKWNSGDSDTKKYDWSINRPRNNTTTFQVLISPSSDAGSEYNHTYNVTSRDANGNYNITIDASSYMQYNIYNRTDVIVYANNVLGSVTAVSSPASGGGILNDQISYPTTTKSVKFNYRAHKYNQTGTIKPGSGSQGYWTDEVSGTYVVKVDDGSHEPLYCTITINITNY